MVSYSRRDMKVPARPAPLPPTSSRNRSLHRSTSALDDWEDRSDDPFSRQICPPRPLSAQLGQPPGGKKKPPPRPPPPKFTQKNGRKQVPVRPSSLLSGLFSRASRNQQQQQQHQQVVPSYRHKKDPAPPAPIAVASLIDFDSPSSSPTPTTHSSSDGLSVNSFGSDGSTSLSRQTPVGLGSSSIFESGFEDDFDFFSSLSNSSSFGVTPISEEKDPWSPVQSQDPFSPPRPNTNSNLFESISVLRERQMGNSLFYSDSSRVSKPPEVTKAPTMPTIIRAKPSRPPAPPKANISLFPVSSITEVKGISNGNCVQEDAQAEENEDERDDWSPPMPTIPPPPLPPEAYLELDDGPIVTENISQQQRTDIESYGVAVYDYIASHSDDLSFKVNDRIQLLHEINSEWLYGKIGNHEGMFPANFVNVVVPLKSKQEPQGFVVKALYSFSAETWDDLTFQEGDKICVISRINDDWLYGKCGGRNGQFPAAFVDTVPPNLPPHRA